MLKFEAASSRYTVDLRTVSYKRFFLPGNASQLTRAAARARSSARGGIRRRRLRAPRRRGSSAGRERNGLARRVGGLGPLPSPRHAARPAGRLKTHESSETCRPPLGRGCSTATGHSAAPTNDAGCRLWTGLLELARSDYTEAILNAVRRLGEAPF